MQKHIESTGEFAVKHKFLVSLQKYVHKMFMFFNVSREIEKC